jgi:LuxR family transcriptional regulator
MNDFALSETLGEFKERSGSGYAMGLHISFTTPTYFFQSYPRPWLEYYSQAGLLMNDPTVSWCFENTGTCRWSDLEDPANILGQAAEYGMKYGMLYATTTGGSHSMSGFARPDREFTDEEIAELVERFEALHVATKDQKALTPSTVEQLKKMSIIVTHPGS